MALAMGTVIPTPFGIHSTSASQQQAGPGGAPSHQLYLVQPQVES